MINSVRKTMLLAAAFFSIVSSRSIWIEGGDESNSLGRRATSDLLGKMQGVNMAGLEFGIGTNGETSGNSFVAPPLDQIPHFVGEGLNIIRFPFGWQYMQSTLKGELTATYLALLDQYVDATLQKNAFVILDLHNYARRDGKIVGESDLSADTLVDLWTRLAKHYQKNSNVIFGLMNEPHDVTSKTWIGVVQQVVTAIRSAGATKNYILLPGNNWSHLKTFADDYNSGLSAVKNPDGSFDGLIFEIHQYFDSDGSGTAKECNQDHLDELESVVALLKKDNRQALVTEFGGGNSQSCTDIITKFVKAVENDYPSIAGILMWGGGSFAAVSSVYSLIANWAHRLIPLSNDHHQDYTLVVAVKNGDEWKDQANLSAMRSALTSK